MKLIPSAQQNKENIDSESDPSDFIAIDYTIHLANNLLAK
ncbi:13578_t:CDS:2 [Funneliformis caledonium]|uniref:13578_t:CDS:1 n=1 Tax=Funneliformis caledonium TaxID=1117310 RepID=A0A9N9CBA3_9GLOM|nr:13578_t:CDS:2 [Funneliformis caledonium]